MVVPPWSDSRMPAFPRYGAVTLSAGKAEMITLPRSLLSVPWAMRGLLAIWSVSSRHREAGDDYVEYDVEEAAVRRVRDRQAVVVARRVVVRVGLHVRNERNGVDDGEPVIEPVLQVLDERRLSELRLYDLPQHQPVGHAGGANGGGDGLKAVDAVLAVVQRVGRVVRPADDGVRYRQVLVDLNPVDRVPVGGVLAVLAGAVQQDVVRQASLGAGPDDVDAGRLVRGEQRRVPLGRKRRYPE